MEKKNNNTTRQCKGETVINKGPTKSNQYRQEQGQNKIESLTTQQPNEQIDKPRNKPDPRARRLLGAAPLTILRDGISLIWEAKDIVEQHWKAINTPCSLKRRHIRVTNVSCLGLAEELTS